MLNKFVAKEDCVKWYSSNIPKNPSPLLTDKPSYAEKVKSKDLNHSGSQIETEEVSKAARQREKQYTAGHSPPPTPKAESQKQWVIKNLEVAQTKFDQLWIVTKLFALDNWREIRKVLEFLFQTKIVISPLFDENALISLNQGLHQWRWNMAVNGLVSS